MLNDFLIRYIIYILLFIAITLVVGFGSIGIALKRHDRKRGKNDPRVEEILKRVDKEIEDDRK